MPQELADQPDEGYGHKKQGRARSALTGMVWSVLTNLTPTLVAALVFLLTSRVLMPADFGIVAFAAALIATLAVMTPTGFGDAIVQRASISEAHFSTVFWLCTGAGVLLYLFVLLLCIPIASYYHNPMLATLLPVLGLKIILDQLYIVPKALLSRTMSFRKIAMRSMMASLVAAAVCLAVLYAGFGLWALVMSQIVTSLVSCVVSWMSVSWRPSFTFSRAAFRELAGFGLYSSGSVIVSTIKVEQLMLGGLMGAPVLGLFGFARRMFQMVADVMTNSLGAVTYPLLASMQNELPKLREAYLTTTFLSSVLAVPCFVGLALVADEFVPLLFGAQWVDAVTPLRAYCAVGVLYGIGVLQASLIRSRGRADFWMWYQVVQQGTTALVILATYRLGIEAVAIAMAVKTWLIWPFSAMFAARLIGLPARKYLSQFAAPLAAALAMALAVYAVRLALPGGGVLSLALQILAGAAVYALAILILARRRLGQILQLVARGRRRKAG